MLTEATIHEWLEELEHVLPSQRPLNAFVHHNTLHAFEGLPFHEGVEQAAQRFGARAYMSKEAYREAWRAGRIHAADLEDALARTIPDAHSTLGAQTLHWRDIVRSWMLGLSAEAHHGALSWHLEETDAMAAYPASLPRRAYERLSAAGPAERVQPELWARICALVPASTAAATPARVRDVVHQRHGVDPDELVHPKLIRWCAAFLDAGTSSWPMSARAKGFYTAMLEHLSRPLSGPSLWMGSLTRRARRLLAEGVSASACIAETLARMGWSDEEAAHTMLRASLLVMPGWPGMFVQLAARPDVAPAPPPPTSLADYLAVRLLLDEAAARSLSGQPAAPFPREASRAPRQDMTSQRWMCFDAARLLGVLPHEVDAALHKTLRELLDRFDGVRRGWIWQQAYERRFRVQQLDGVWHHVRRNTSAPGDDGARIQLIACIDDREESLRRHFEELDARHETFGAAGFFGLAHYYRAPDAPRPRPLCPAPVIPKHLLVERALDERALATQGALARAEGALTGGSNALVRGGLMALGGWGSLLPMSLQVLAPRAYRRLTTPHRPRASMLCVEASDPPEHEGALQLGYTIPEMVDRVEGLLQSIGLTRDLAPLIVVMGHGSSSQNNPHEAAYQCGACGGNRGGPNARAFAIMANHPAVREALATRGLVIGPEVWFVGAYHDTCDDHITLYDQDAAPTTHAEALAHAARMIDAARARNAHERARRFESARLDLRPDEALAHVQQRAVDLAQPRPEYGHSTNALCLVGKRAWSRGLFLDRRAFLQSYDSEGDDDGARLEALLMAVLPVGAGINLEYFFSFVDPLRYGCDTKLPHNIAALQGVMDGHTSDLRTGLSWQMVEIHEPMRLLHVIEAPPARLEAILARQPRLQELVANRWVLVAALDLSDQTLWFLEGEGFVPYTPEAEALPCAATSADWYRGHREHLPPASIQAPATREVSR